MTNKQIKRWSTSSSLRDMQPKTMRKYHYAPGRMDKTFLKIKQQPVLQSIWSFHIFLMEVQNGAATLENKWAISYKGKHTLITQPSNSQKKCYWSMYCPGYVFAHLLYHRPTMDTETRTLIITYICLFGPIPFQTAASTCPVQMPLP